MTSSISHRAVVFYNYEYTFARKLSRVQPFVYAGLGNHAHLSPLDILRAPWLGHRLANGLSLMSGNRKS